MSRDRVIWLLALLALLGAGWWLFANTEWVDEQRGRPASGAARDNPFYATEQVLRRLGMQVEQHEALDAMPPPGARLVLLSSDWEIKPERAPQLQAWVERGGHLVVTQAGSEQDSALDEWVPVDTITFKPPPRSPAASAAVVDGTTELSSSPALWGGTEQLSSCGLVPNNSRLQINEGRSS
jgi:hypothetical protein